MKRICAWCDRHLGDKEPLEDMDETYGMCVWCLLYMKRKIKKRDKMSHQINDSECPPPPLGGGQVVDI
jgi:hypothetical protein